MALCPRCAPASQEKFQRSAYVFDFVGERGGTRTLDLLIKSQLLYRLSYALVTGRMIGPSRRPSQRAEDKQFGIKRLCAV